MRDRRSPRAKKIMGVDYYVIEVSDKQDHRTRAYQRQIVSRDDAHLRRGRREIQAEILRLQLREGTLVPYRSITSGPTTNRSRKARSAP